MRNRLWFVLTLFGASPCFSAEVYPTKPLRMVVAFVPGGGADAMAFPEEIVAKATPDGHTLLTMGGSFYLTPLLQKVPYDPVREFSPITLVNTFPFVLIVNSSLPAKSVAELIALAESKPGELNYGSGGIGGGNHLGPELLKAMAGINIVRVGYKSGSVALNGLLSNEVQLMVNPPQRRHRM